MLSDVKPINLISNIYYVGTKKYSCHVIDTGDGLIMIDTGLLENADLIVDSLGELGFNIKDVKIIIHSHGHYDHTEATPKLAALSGAKTYMNKADLMYLREGQGIDCYIKDGDIITLGNTEILCREAPGHTIGTMAFFFNTEYKGKVYRAGMFGGVGTNQLRKTFLVRKGRPTLSYFQRDMFFKSIDRMRKEKVDICLGNHPWNNNTLEKAELIETSEINPFLDSSVWENLLNKVKKELEDIIEEETKTLFVNYAHRGASEYTPENTLLSFNLGIYMGANGIETDVQLTKDGIAVLFHDDTLERVANHVGSVKDYTYEELQKFLAAKNGFQDIIPRLDDFLRHFHFRPITFAIELKQRGIAKIVADILRRYDISHKTVVTSFIFDELKEFGKYAPEYKLGYLTDNITDELLIEMRKYRIDEICPEAHLTNAQIVKKWHLMGFNVRAWGVYNTELMKQAYDAGCDGMTVNFPDKLTEYIRKSRIC